MILNMVNIQFFEKDKRGDIAFNADTRWCGSYIFKDEIPALIEFLESQL